MSERRDEPARAEPQADDVGSDVLAEFFANYSGGGHRFLIYRRSPKTWPVGGVVREIEGHLETTEEVPTPDYIKATWGGGSYLVQIQAPSADGRGGYRIVTARTIKISGDPKLRAQDYDPGAQQAVQPAVDPNRPTLADRLMEQAALRSERAEERLERERHERIEAERERARMAAIIASVQDRKPAVDPAVLQHAVSAIQTSAESQVETLRQQLARRDAELAELRKELASGRGLDPQFVQILLGRSKDDEARAIESHRREMDALRREHEQSIGMIERLHRAEVENLRASHDREMRMLQLAHETAVAAKDREVARLETELATARQAQGPSNPMQKIAELAELDELLARRYGRGGPEGEPGWLEQVTSFLSELKDATAAQTRMPPPQIPAPARTVPTLPQLRVVRGGEATASAAVPTVATQAGATAAADIAGLGTLADSAIAFGEAALRAGTPPDELARSAVSMFPRPGVVALAKMDPAALLSQLEAGLGRDHVLVSPGGRDYIRKLLAALGKEVLRE